MNLIEKIQFDDTDIVKSVNNIIGRITELDSSIDVLSKDTKVKSEAMSKSIVDSNRKSAESIKDVAKEFVNLKASRKEIGDVILALGAHEAQAKKVVSVYNKLSEASKAGVILDESDVEDLTQGFSKLADEIGLTDRQLEVLTGNMEQISGELSKFIDNSGFEALASGADKTTKKFTSAKSELRALTNLINSGQLEGIELETAIRRAAELTDEIGDTRAQIAQLASDTRSLDLMVESVSALGAGFQIAEGAAALFGDESEDMQKALVKLNAIMALSQGLQQAMEIATTRGGIASKIAAGAQAIYATAVGASTGVMKAFRVAMLATGVGALIVGIGLLITNFDKVKKSLSETFPFFERLGSVASGVIDGVVAGFKTLSSVVSKIFSGDFSGAYQEAKSLGSNIAKAYNQGVEEGDVEAANKALAKSITATVENQKRRLAILEAGGKESFALQKTILSNELKALELAGAEKKEILDKQLELDVLVAQKQKEIYEKAKQIREKAVSDFAKIKEDLFKLSSEFKLITPKEQFDFVKEKQIENIKKAKADLIALGKTLGKDVSKDVKNLDLIIEGLSSRDFTSTLAPIKKLSPAVSSAVKELQNRLIELENIEINFGVDTQEARDKIKDQIYEALNNPLSSEVKTTITVPAPTLVPTGAIELDLGSDLDIFLGDVNNFSDLLRKSLDEVFGEVGGEKAAAALGGLKSFVGALNNIANEASQIRLDMIDAQLESLSERREELQAGLDEELEDQEQSLANNVGAKQAEVDAIIAEETRLKAEQERIKQESAKRQAAIETATQAASLITTSIEIYKGFAGLPFGLGIPLAIAAIGSLFSFFAATKINAAKATRLYTGTGDGQIRDFFGFANKHGESDLPGKGLGYRLYDERTKSPTNVIISGKEMMLPESISLPHAQFFSSLRAGVYDGIDLSEAVGFFKNFKESKTKVSTQSSGTNHLIHKANSGKSKHIVPYINKKGESMAVVLTIDDSVKDGTIIELH